MSSSGTTKTENLKADIVVIGGGGAGLVAAVAAAEKGTNNVILLEVRHALGGNAVFAGGPFAVEGQQQQLKDEFFKKAMAYTHRRLNPRLLRALIDKSNDTLRWLEDKGLKFEWRKFPSRSISLPFYIGPEKTSGAAVVKALTRKCKELGVQILCDTRARRLLTSEAGKVSGVLAEAKGKEIRITAKSVIIATGGFAGNKELLKKYLPTYHEDDAINIKGLPHQGDGLLMATEVGAATEGTITLEMSGPVFPWSSYLSQPVTMHHNTVWVNKKGERFAEELMEPFENGNCLYRQPGKMSYTIFDENIKQIILHDEGIPMRPPDAGKNWAAEVDRELRLQANKGRVKITDSWGEMAEWMGVAPEVLKATIDEYNSFCDKGHDDIFAKDPEHLVPLRTPPYYAIRCCLNLLVTHGPLKINHHTEVLDSQDEPIPGLYVAGVDAGGTDSDTYYGVLPAHSFGFTVNSGRIAGEKAAEFAKGK